MGQCRGKFRDMHLHFLFCSVLFAGVAVAMVWAMVWVTTVWR